VACGALPTSVGPPRFDSAWTERASGAEARPVGLRPPGPVNVPSARQILDVPDVRAGREAPGDALQVAIDVDGCHIGAAVVLSGRLQTVADTVGLGHGQISCGYVPGKGRSALEGEKWTCEIVLSQIRRTAGSEEDGGARREEA
jgi:hypothetical protein